MSAENAPDRRDTFNFLPGSAAARAQASPSILVTLAVASLVFGLLALFLSPVLIGGVLGLVGLTLGVLQIALGNVKRSLAVWGIALSLAGVTTSVVAGLFYYHWYRSREQHSREDSTTESADARSLDSWQGVTTPALSFTTIEGKLIEMETLKGRAVVLNRWATWCKACVEEMPHLQRLAEERTDDLTIIGVSDEPAATLQAFARSHRITYALVSAPDVPAPLDAADALPTNFFIDREGVIRRTVVGFQDYDALKALAFGSDVTPPVRKDAPPVRKDKKAEP